MKKININKLSTVQILGLYARTLDKLKDRGVVRTTNNPVADYCEHIVQKALKLKLKPNSNKGYDATDSKGFRYQIKSRRITESNSSRELGKFCDIKKAKFSYLVAVLFNGDFSIKEAYKIPKRLVVRYGRHNERKNEHKLILSGEILNAKGVERIDEKLNKFLKCGVRP